MDKYIQPFRVGDNPLALVNTNIITCQCFKGLIYIYIVFVLAVGV